MSGVSRQRKRGEHFARRRKGKCKDRHEWRRLSDAPAEISAWLEEQYVKRGENLAHRKLVWATYAW